MKEARITVNLSGMRIFINFFIKQTLKFVFIYYTYICNYVYAKTLFFAYFLDLLS